MSWNPFGSNKSSTTSNAYDQHQVMRNGGAASVSGSNNKVAVRVTNVDRKTQAESIKLIGKLAADNNKAFKNLVGTFKGLSSNVLATSNNNFKVQSESIATAWKDAKGPGMEERVLIGGVLLLGAVLVFFVVKQK